MTAGGETGPVDGSGATAGGDRPVLREYLFALSALSAVLSFQYLPFQYLVGFLGVGKLSFFFLLVAGSLALLLLNGVLDGWRRGMAEVVPLVLQYELFATVVLVSFGSHPDHLGDSAALISIVLLNPLFLLLGYACRPLKNTIVWGVLLMAFLYLLFVAVPVLSGLAQGGRITPDMVFPGLELEVGFYQNVNFFLGLLFIASLAFPGGSRLLRLVVHGVGWLSFLAMFVVGGRGAFMAALVVLLVHLTATHWLRLWRDPRKLAGLCLLGVVLWLAARNLSFLLEYSETLRRLMVLTEGGDASRRAFLFASAVELFLSSVKTLFLGGGYNSFQTYIGDFSEGMYPHNIMLEVLAEYGLVGLGLFLLPVAGILRRRVKVLGSLVGRSQVEIAVFNLALYFWTTRMFSGGMRTSWFLMFFTALLLPSLTRKEDPGK